jgi:hypothetical protein
MTTTPTSAEMLRARFEALAKEHGYDFLKDSQGEYIARIAQFAWQAVQAMNSGDDARDAERYR